MTARWSWIAALLLLPSLMFADVAPDWHAGFGPPPTGLGLDGDPRALLHHHDALYCGGSFSQAGSTTAWFAARLDESFGAYSWTSIGDLDNRVDAMIAWGDSVLAGGRFTLADGVVVNRVAVFDSTAWSPVGSPGAWTWGGVLSLTLHDGLPWAAGTDFVVRWTGSAWVDAVGAGFSGDVFALASYDGDVFMAGAFSSVPNLSGDPTTAANIARWDGAAWQPVGSGLDGTGYAMTPWRDDLVVGGVFTSPANKAARWNGTSWSALGSGLIGQYVTAIAGWGARLIVGGDLSAAGGSTVSDVAIFDNAVWSDLGGGVDGMVRAISAKDGDVMVGGGFLMVGGSTASSHLGLWIDPTVGVDQTPHSIPISNWPNPFNPSTTVLFAVDSAGPAHIAVYDLGGRIVRTLVDGHLDAGRHRIVWNGCGDDGRSLGSGSYLLRGSTLDGVGIRRLSLIR